MSEPVARIVIELEGTDPLVWRELDLPLSTTLATLHEIIQVVMRWWDCHLHEFVVGGKIYGVPHPDDVIYERKVYHSRSIRLETLIDRGVRDFLYIYDFGDNWQHRIRIKHIRDGDAGAEYPRFVAGERRAPPEDVGGVSGFEEFLEIMADPEHDAYAQTVEWYGQVFDPKDLDVRRLNMIIEDFAARRRGPLRSHRTGSRRSRN